MSKSKQHIYVNPTNLFDEDSSDDQCDDAIFRPRIPPPPPKATPKDQHLQNILEKRREIESRTLESSARSIGHLLEAEASGISTAEELIRQREALENTGRRLGDMMPKLETSQKHINGIKSVFHGLKQYVIGNRDRTPSPSDSRASSSVIRRVGSSGSRLNQTISKMADRDKFSTHPSTRLRGLDLQVSPEHYSVDSSVDKQLESNLDEMCQVIAKLKGLGVAIGEEIDEQNKIIEVVTDKVNKVDLSVTSQNKQINNLLG